MGAVVSRELEIRRSSPEDETFVAALAREAFAPFSLHAENTTRRMLHEPGSVTLIATRGGRRVGFVVIEAHGQGHSSIQAIAVPSSERGQGVGERLMTAAVRFARDTGSRHLRLCTAQANVEALSLFMKAGFHIVRRMPRFYPRGQDACELSLSL
jgi:ribosomal protein S18 acetylase RimI-like enzyme